ncbi:MAG: glycosyltransferase family 39 protein [Candidatus Shapirobacteria bacterium]
MKWKLLSIILLIFGLRLIGINQSLWLDEAVSANVVKNYDFGGIIKNFSPNDFHPPLYYLALKLWTNYFGYSVVSMRLLSILFSIITIYLVFLIGKKIKDEKFGYWAAIMTGLNPLLWYYSHEVRMYSLITMLLTAVVYCWVTKKYFWLNLWAFLAFSTFYGSVFLLATISLYLIIKKRWKEVFIMNIGLGAAVLCWRPLLQIQMKNAQVMLLEVKNWSLVLGKANLKNLLLVPVKMTSGKISFYPKWLYFLISGIWAGWLGLKILKNGLSNKKFLFLAIMPLVLGFLFSLGSPMMQYFRFLYLVPIIALILAGGKNRGLVAIGFLVFGLTYALNQNFHREDWKNLAANLENKVYMIGSFGDPVKYYRKEVEIMDLRNNIEDREISVIPYGAEIHGLDYKKKLTDLGYKRIEEKNFLELKLEKWKKD